MNSYFVHCGGEERETGYMEKQYSTVMAEQDESEGIELGELLVILLSNIKLIVISTLVAGLLVFLVSAFVVTPMYTAGISIYVNNATNTNVNTNKIESADINASQLLVNTYITIVQSNRVLNDVAKECGSAYTADEIKKMMVTTAVQNTEIFQVTIENKDPKAAANIAN
ncbi:MAG: Wzz/FepE/Etk N-terminal domain-containing protein, partial [Anaerovorax sp.]